MLDVLLRNGVLVDGTGVDRRVADVGISDGRIATVGATNAAARQVIDVDGLIVCPGFIDLHSHYDAQLFWDPVLSPSPMHGVTTVVAGNCGLTLAPVRPQDQEFMTRLLARVEAIPVEALLAGVEYRWETYAEFLDVVDATPLGINMAFMVGHSAIRRNVMGPAASERAATEAELDAMCAVLDGALAAGGVGFSTANVMTQVDGDGRPTPPNFATHDELVALAAVCGRHPGTSIEFIPGSFLVGFSDEEIDLMVSMSAAANRHLNWNTPLINKATPNIFRRQLSATDYAAERGARIVPLYMLQNGPNQQDFKHGYVYRALPDWGFLFELDPPARIRALRDPAVRARLAAGLDGAAAGLAVTMRTSWGKHIVNEAHHESVRHLNGRRIADIAAERGTTDFETVLDIAVEAELEIGFVRYTQEHTDEWSQQARLEVLNDPRVVFGASDSGAHMDMMVGADFTTRCLADLVREQGVFTTERLVQQFTSVPADLYGLRDRGRIVEGAIADVVVFDEARVGAGALQTRRDLPTGASRLITDALGIARVIVGGQTVVERGELTGELPGRLLRSHRDFDTVTAR